MKKFDVAIIGAGSAGLSARREVAKITQNYCVIDDGILGTTCARVGCMPSKVLIQVAQDFDRRHKLKEQGINGAQNLTIDHVQVMNHVRTLRDRFVRAVTGDMSDWVDTHLIRKRARFVDPHTLDLGDETIYANKIIIATGSRPNIPNELLPFKDYLMTTDFFFEEKSLPKKMAVLGLGVIGIEIGQALARLGVDVIGITRRAVIAGTTDPDITEYVTRKFSESMNITFNGIEKIKAYKDKLIISSDTKEFEVEKILVTTGRTPNLESLDLDKICKKLENNIPEFRLDTMSLKEHDHIFIAGDVNGLRPILHEASDQGKIAGFNAVNSKTSFIHRVPVEITFCDPNIAAVGKRYSQLVEEKIDFVEGKVLFEGQGRSIIKLKEIGMLKVYGHRESGELLGAELFAPDGEHLAHLLAWVISQKLTVNQVLSLPFYHPVVEEGLRTALRDLRSKVGEAAPALEIYPEVTL